MDDDNTKEKGACEGQSDVGVAVKGARGIVRAVIVPERSEWDTECFR